eukprot:682072-Pyramimonas_sp.AAC.1
MDTGRGGVDSDRMNRNCCWTSYPSFPCPSRASTTSGNPTLPKGGMSQALAKRRGGPAAQPRSGA